MNVMLDTHTFLWFMLVAQARIENMTIVSADDALDAYGVQRAW